MTHPWHSSHYCRRLQSPPPVSGQVALFNNLGFPLKRCWKGMRVRTASSQNKEARLTPLPSHHKLSCDAQTTQMHSHDSCVTAVSLNSINFKTARLWLIERWSTREIWRIGKWQLFFIIFNIWCKRIKCSSCHSLVLWTLFFQKILNPNQFWWPMLLMQPCWV